MSKESHVVVVRLAAEGGLIQVSGRKKPDGQWVFWRSNPWGDDKGEPEYCDRLEDLIPQRWPIWVPKQVHPEFVDWFASRFEAATNEMVRRLPEIMERPWGSRWARVFAGEPLDS